MAFRLRAMKPLGVLLLFAWLLASCGGNDHDAGGSGGISSGTGGAGTGGVAGAGGVAGTAGSGGTPCPAATTEAVQQTNPYGSLKGVLEIPEGCAQTVVLFVSGTGSQNRDGNAQGSTTDTFKMLAAALRKSGVATLRYDDHGVGESVSAAPPLTEFTFDLEVKDAAGWVQQLRADGRFSKVVIAGHSQGSLAGLLAHQQAPVDKLVSLAGTARPAGQLLIDQVASKLTPDQLTTLKKAIAELEAGKLPGPLPAPLDQLLPTTIQPYMITYMKWDPTQEIKKFGGPLLIVQGTTDRKVKVEDAKALKAAQPNGELSIIENMSHSLKQATHDLAQQKAAQTDPSVPLAAGLVTAVSQFLNEAPPRDG